MDNYAFKDTMNNLFKNNNITECITIFEERKIAGKYKKTNAEISDIVVNISGIWLPEHKVLILEKHIEKIYLIPDEIYNKFYDKKSYVTSLSGAARFCVTQTDEYIELVKNYFEPIKEEVKTNIAKTAYRG